MTNEFNDPNNYYPETPQKEAIEKHDSVFRRKKYFFVSFLIGLFFVTVILFVGIAYFFLSKDKNIDSHPISSVTISPFPNPSKNPCGNDAKICPNGSVSEKTGPECKFIECQESASDMTTYWKIINTNEKNIRTFQNIDLNYTFNLPTNWKFIGHDSGFLIYSPNLNCPSGTTYEEFQKCNGAIIEMLSTIQTANSNIEDWYNSDENSLLKNSDIKTKRIINKMTIAKLNALEVINNSHSKSYYFLFDNTVYVLKIESATTADMKNSLPTLKDIISSFKFLTLSPTPTCRPRPACLDSFPACKIVETSDMCRSSPTPDPNKIFCGGIMGVTCPAGYSCKNKSDYPDASGVCIKD